MNVCACVPVYMYGVRWGAQIWDVLVELLVREAQYRLVHRRHVDLVLLCTVYAVSRPLAKPTDTPAPTFKQILHEYRRQPQCHDKVRRTARFAQRTVVHACALMHLSVRACVQTFMEVDVRDLVQAQTAPVDIIRFYNTYFIARAGQLITSMAARVCCYCTLLHPPPLPPRA
jgi:hypothetical protein